MSDDVQQRKHNPRSHKCPIHLRRICGTCANFGGALRGGERAECKRHLSLFHPLASGADCEEYTRK